MNALTQIHYRQRLRDQRKRDARAMCVQLVECCCSWTGFVVVLIRSSAVHHIIKFKLFLCFLSIKFQGASFGMVSAQR